MAKYKVTLGHAPHSASYERVEAEDWNIPVETGNLLFLDKQGNCIRFYAKGSFWKIEKV